MNRQRACPTWTNNGNSTYNQNPQLHTNAEMGRNIIHDLEKIIGESSQSKTNATPQKEFEPTGGYQNYYDKCAEIRVNNTSILPGSSISSLFCTINQNRPHQSVTQNHASTPAQVAGSADYIRQGDTFKMTMNGGALELEQLVELEKKLQLVPCRALLTILARRSLHKNVSANASGPPCRQYTGVLWKIVNEKLDELSKISKANPLHGEIVREVGTMVALLNANGWRQNTDISPVEIAKTGTCDCCKATAAAYCPQPLYSNPLIWMSEAAFFHAHEMRQRFKKISSEIRKETMTVGTQTDNTYKQIFQEAYNVAVNRIQGNPDMAVGYDQAVRASRSPHHPGSYPMSPNAMEFTPMPRDPMYPFNMSHPAQSMIHVVSPVSKVQLPAYCIPSGVHDDLMGMLPNMLAGSIPHGEAMYATHSGGYPGAMPANQLQQHRSQEIQYYNVPDQQTSEEPKHVFPTFKPLPGGKERPSITISEVAPGDESRSTQT